MDFFKRLFELIIYNKENGEELSKQVFLFEDEDTEKESVISFYPDKNGNIVFTLFNTDQWDMINDISELTYRDKFAIIEEMVSSKEIESWVIDPAEFPGDVDDDY